MYKVAVALTKGLRQILPQLQRALGVTTKQLRGGLSPAQGRYITHVLSTAGHSGNWQTSLRSQRYWLKQLETAFKSGDMAGAKAAADRIKQTSFQDILKNISRKGPAGPPLDGIAESFDLPEVRLVARKLPFSKYLAGYRFPRRSVPVGKPLTEIIGPPQGDLLFKGYPGIHGYTRGALSKANHNFYTPNPMTALNYTHSRAPLEVLKVDKALMPEIKAGTVPQLAAPIDFRRAAKFKKDLKLSDLYNPSRGLDDDFEVVFSRDYRDMLKQRAKSKLYKLVKVTDINATSDTYKHPFHYGEPWRPGVSEVVVAPYTTNVNHGQYPLKNLKSSALDNLIQRLSNASTTP